MKIRMENTEDHDAVREVNFGAFPGEDEVHLIEKLKEYEDVISLVAIEDNKMVGHIIFSALQQLKMMMNHFLHLHWLLWRFYPNFKGGV